MQHRTRQAISNRLLIIILQWNELYKTNVKKVTYVACFVKKKKVIAMLYLTIQIFFYNSELWDNKLQLPFFILCKKEREKTKSEVISCDSDFFLRTKSKHHIVRYKQNIKYNNNKSQKYKISTLHYEEKSLNYEIKSQNYFYIYFFLLWQKQASIVTTPLLKWDEPN